MSRVEESRLRVQDRLSALGKAADREMGKARRIKDAALAVLGVIGALLAAKRVGRALRQKRKRRQLGKERGPTPGRSEGSTAGSS